MTRSSSAPDDPDKITIGLVYGPGPNWRESLATVLRLLAARQGGPEVYSEELGRLLEKVANASSVEIAIQEAGAAIDLLATVAQIVVEVALLSYHENGVEIEAQELLARVESAIERMVEDEGV